MLAIFIALVSIQSIAADPLLTAVRDANDALRKLVAPNQRDIQSEFNRPLSLWIDPSAVQFTFDDDERIEYRIIIRHPNRGRYRTAGEQTELDEAIARYQNLMEVCSGECDMVLASHQMRWGRRPITWRYDIEAAGLRERRREIVDKWAPKIAAAKEHMDAVIARVRAAESRRRDAVEIVRLTIAINADLANQIRLRRDPVRITVIVTDFDIKREPPEIGGKFHLFRMALKQNG